jgi:hypothetical protein
MKKIVTVCLGGQVRSVAMANYLNKIYPVIAVPVANANPFPGNFNWYMNWADIVIAVGEADLMNRLPEDKRIQCNVGFDTYGNPDNPELNQKIEEWCKQNEGRFI